METRQLPYRPLAALAASILVASCAHGPKKEAGAPETISQAATVVPSGEPKNPPLQPQFIQPRIFPGTGNFVNTKPPAAPATPGPEEVTLNFEGVDVREIAKVILADYLNESYTVHPSVQGTITFRTIRAIPKKDLLPTLEMLLRQNNASVVREEGIYKILPIAAVRGSVSPQLGGSNLPLPSGFSVLVVPLKFVGAREMAKLLEPFAADNTIRIDENRNLVIMAGSQRELKHLVDTVELFDVDWLSGYSVGLFPVKSSDVKSVVQDIEKVFGGAGGPQGGANPLAGIVRVIPMERLNALFIVTTQPKYLEMARAWIDRMDQIGSAVGGSKFYVYQVKNGKAENLAQLVGDLFSSRRTTTSAPTLAPGQRPTEIRSAPFGQATTPGQTTTTSVTPAPSVAFSMPGSSGGTTGEVRVIADKETNSLLILAAPNDYEVVESAIRKLDVTRRQVLVEVLLAEVSLTDDLKFGVDWFLRAKGNTIIGAQNTSGTLTGNLPKPADTIAGAAATVSPFGGLQLINLSGTEVRAVLRALGSDNKTQVLAAPQIMVLDNEKAEIKVGNRISVQTQSQTVPGTTTGIQNSFQYLETGVLLAVTPRINSGGMVTLEINQEVSAPSGEGTQVNPNPDVLTRNAKTSVQVASGESIVLGGLIQENKVRDTSGIPLLSKIPVLGALFGTQTINRTRTELVMMVTPRIVSDPSQAREVTEELRRKLPSLRDLLPKPPESPAPVNPAPVLK